MKSVVVLWRLSLTAEVGLQAPGCAKCVSVMLFTLVFTTMFVLVPAEATRGLLPPASCVAVAGVVWLAGSVGLRSSWQYVQVANCADTWIVLAVPKLPAGRDAKDIGPVPPPCTCRSPGPWQASHPTTGRGTFPV